MKWIAVIVLLLAAVVGLGMSLCGGKFLIDILIGFIRHPDVRRQIDMSGFVLILASLSLALGAAILVSVFKLIGTIRKPQESVKISIWIATVIVSLFIAGVITFWLLTGFRF